LKVVFGIVTMTALVIYFLLPITVAVTCDCGKTDYQNEISVGDIVNLEGRHRVGLQNVRADFLFA